MQSDSIQTSFEKLSIVRSQPEVRAKTAPTPQLVRIRNLLVAEPDITVAISSGRVMKKYIGPLLHIFKLCPKSDTEDWSEFAEAIRRYEFENIMSRQQLRVFGDTASKEELFALRCLCRKNPTWIRTIGLCDEGGNVQFYRYVIENDFVTMVEPEENADKHQGMYAIVSSESTYHTYFRELLYLCRHEMEYVNFTLPDATFIENDLLELRCWY